MKTKLSLGKKQQQQNPNKQTNQPNKKKTLQNQTRVYLRLKCLTVLELLLMHELWLFKNPK